MKPCPKDQHSFDDARGVGWLHEGNYHDKRRGLVSRGSRKCDRCSVRQRFEFWRDATGKHHEKVLK